MNEPTNKKRTILEELIPALRQYRHNSGGEKENHGDCDICGEYSTMLVGGVCQKAVCQRHVEEGKHDLCGKAWLDGEYAGQGNE